MADHVGNAQHGPPGRATIVPIPAATFTSEAQEAGQVFENLPRSRIQLSLTTHENVLLATLRDELPDTDAR